ncbi:MAG: DUF58 domain-containing protein [Fimbriimonadaceae bacterium]|nr:DUF58 domain-containing protein [Fimbriimonadaceae bacterium]
MVPTPRLWLVLAIGIPLSGLAASVGAYGWIVAYNLGVLGLAFLTTRLAGDLRGVKVRRQTDAVLSVRVKNRVEVELVHDGDRAYSGWVLDQPPSDYGIEGNHVRFRLEPGGTFTFSYSVTPGERGSDRFEATYFRIECPLGLAWRDIRLETEAPIRVYPNLLALREFDLLNQLGRLREVGIRRSRLRGTGTEFESLRDYALGDDYRKIDHKASARRGKLVVRQFETERNQSVFLVIDTGRHMLSEVYGVRKLDHVLDSLLMLCNAAASASDLVGLLVYSDTVRRYIPPRKGRNQVGFVIEACHDLVAEPLESDFISAIGYLRTKWKRRSLIVVFSDYEDPDRAGELVTALAPLAHRHIVLVVRVQDGRLQEVETAPLAKPQDMYMRVAANLLLEDRKEASKRLRSAGIHELESEPQELASKLVTFYFDVKARGLL